MSRHSLPQEIIESVSRKTGEEILDFSFSGNSSFSNTGKLVTSRNEYFIKWIEIEEGNRGMFAEEYKGLELLRKTRSLRLPQVYLEETHADLQFIVLERIVERPRRSDYWETLARELASMHRQSNDEFGLDHNNFIGILPQPNAVRKDWITFFIDNRLSLADRFDVGFRKRMNKLIEKLPEWIPVEKPALLHGDLWNGNVLADERGGPCVIDPAPYYGHREAEIAFSKLFGGFHPSFYGAYNEVFPLAEGHAEREEIFNLYPLLVHAILFGGSYLSQADGIIRRRI